MKHCRCYHVYQPPQPFYRNQQVEAYARQPTRKVTMGQLIAYGRHMTPLKLIKSANSVRQELAVRLAHRIRDFQSLPFVVGTHPRIGQVYDLYWQAFDRLYSLPAIQTMPQNHAFCRFLEDLLSEHMTVIPQSVTTVQPHHGIMESHVRLALGMRECRSYLDRALVDRFMNDMLRTRIGRRVLAEQHIALTAAFTAPPSSIPESAGKLMRCEGSRADLVGERIGIISTACHAGRTVEKCVELATTTLQQSGSLVASDRWDPKVVVDGHTDATFLYIPDHIEYILFELIKSAFRQQSSTMHASEPIRITVCTAPSPLRHAHKHPPHASREPSSMLTFRISDQGGGVDRAMIPPEDPMRIWSFSHLDQSTQDTQQSHEGKGVQVQKVAGKLSDPPMITSQPGLGLQLARVFAQYWGGDVTLRTMYGYGTDAYVRIATTGDDSEHLTVDETLPSRMEVTALQAQLDAHWRTREQLRDHVKGLDEGLRAATATLNGIHSDDRCVADLLAHLETVDWPRIRAALVALQGACPPGEHYRYQDVWQRSVQTACFLCAMTLYLKQEPCLSVRAVTDWLQLPVESPANESDVVSLSRFHVTIEDVLHGWVSMAGELARWAVTSVIQREYGRPLRISRFLQTLYAGLQLLQLKNDSLRKRFDSIKYDIKRVEEVVYNIKLRGLAPEDP